MIEKRTQQKGTTLLEIIIYFALIGIILLAAMSFSIQILRMNKISGNYNELQTNLDFISEKIAFAIQTADSVNNNDSIFYDDNGALSLNTYIDDEKSTVKFYLSEGDIFIKKGADEPIKLNSDLLKFKTLYFQKVSYPKAPDHIITDAELTLKNNEIAQLDKELTLHLSISLRNL